MTSTVASVTSATAEATEAGSAKAPAPADVLVVTAETTGSSWNTVFRAYNNRGNRDGMAAIQGEATGMDAYLLVLSFISF